MSNTFIEYLRSGTRDLGKIKETVLPLAPATEQHRIVTKVDQLMALCDQLKTRLAQARQLCAAAF